MLSKAMLSCHEASLLSSKAIDHKLDMAERMKLAYHHMHCRVCKKYENDIFLLHHYFRNHHLYRHNGGFHLSMREKEQIKENIKKYLIDH